ncbi:ABC transporter ATP-binding protein [Fulvimarina sp. 2208YS6-2-32]|uniref:ABC transporter ATP-binding protein n=1 Tax=Fulvimarina uroteuthidis TaxID=3098149 RepID=A0ABU5I4C2_9HYPH|nr:ABC transporter ATP-binding protein [Fulvimarina sp. 2208YS6-2-32]MDY8109011.1 ABC transporter ATP-binding protein [Fulvimarina sp. 2208YS6-2-32]
MSYLTLEKVGKIFGSSSVVSDFDLAVERGEFVSVLGPSGCGKTTVLRMVAGFERPSFGSIRIGGEDVTVQPANRRRIGMVFQAYALFPNMNVRDNVAFGLKVAGMDRRAIAGRVEEMLSLISLGHLAERYPYQLSGGQQQRVALARALAPRPKLLLLDEPLSALDAKIRVSLREDIRRIQRELAITTLFVTHDQEEALSIADRVVVMHRGRADQIASPLEIYNRPATRFVAEFVGTLNLFDAEMAQPGVLRFAGLNVETPMALTCRADEKIVVGLRPETLSLERRTEDDLSVTGTMLSTSFLGAVIRAQIDVDGRVIRLDMLNRGAGRLPPIGETVELRFSKHDLLVLSN